VRAQALIAAASPKSADLHLVQSGVGGHALVVDGSRFYNLDANAFEALSEAIDQGVARDAIEAAGLAATVPAIGQGDCISKQGQEPGEVGFVPTGSLELAPE
jgi:hypothetical protein